MALAPSTNPEDLSWKQVLRPLPFQVYKTVGEDPGPVQAGATPWHMDPIQDCGSGEEEPPDKAKQDERAEQKTRIGQSARHCTTASDHFLLHL